MLNEHTALANAPEGQRNLIDYTAAQLLANKGKGLVYVGGANNCAASADLYLAACYLNAVLGNEGETVSSQPRTSAIAADTAKVKELLAGAAAGTVKTLIISGANPAYSLPGAAEQLAAAQAKGCVIVAITDHKDETAAFATHIASATHDLEGYGDAEVRPGVFALQQAVIRPLWNVREPQQSLISFAAAAGAEAFQVEPVQLKEQVAVISREPIYQAAVAGVRSWLDYLKATWSTDVRTKVGAVAGEKVFWKTALANGVVGEPSAKSAGGAGFQASVAAPKTSAVNAGSFSLQLSASRTLGDGSQGNNAWLCETPDPVSKVTWDNYLAVGITDAKALGLRKNDVVDLSWEGGSLNGVPVQIQPGQVQGTVELFLGWGRHQDVGEVCHGGDGQDINAFALFGDRRWGTAVKVVKGGGSYVLASTQYHHYMDGRNLVLDDPIDSHKQDPDGSGRSHHALWSSGSGNINRDVTDPGKVKQSHNLSMWDSTHVFPGRRWGMAVDLNACNGCGACIVACGAENNVPVVGREEVRRGRELHWLRIDRYYTSELTEGRSKYADESDSDEVEKNDPEHLDVYHQPVMCQHCGHAPCEEVCPAMATMRNDEGVNIQIYNRCIGTRFCANNCPYKVRRFNFYEYSKYRFGPRTEIGPLNRVAKNVIMDGATSSQAEMEKGYWYAPLAMLLNPTVTVRSKGVMEKCNFCIQRTRDIREVEKASNTAYDDSDVTLTTACAQTCPTAAITFGDINDAFSEVGKQIDPQTNPHQYHLLDVELNTRPAVTYLRHVRNRPQTKEEVKEFEHHGGHGDHSGDAAAAGEEH